MRCVEPELPEETPVVLSSEDRFQLLEQDPFVHVSEKGGRCPVHLTVDAVEVADLVRIQVDSHGNPTGPAREDRVHVAILAEAPGMTAQRSRVFGHAETIAPPLSPLPVGGARLDRRKTPGPRVFRGPLLRAP